MLNKKNVNNYLPEKIKQLLNFFEASSEVILICDMGLIIQYVNHSFTKKTGYKLKEIVGVSYKEYNPDGTKMLLNKKNWDKLLNGKNIKIICNNVKKNGENYFLEKSVIPVHSKNNTGEVTHLIFSGKDNTEQINAINKILVSKKALNEANKIAKLGFYRFDIKNNSWTCSKELHTIFGINDGFPKNFNSWISIVHPEFKETMIQYFNEEVLGKKKIFDKEYKIINLKTGIEKWVHGLGHLNFDKNQQPFEMFGTIQDITDRKLISEQLVAKEKALLTAQKNAKIGYWELDLTKNVLTWSDQIYQIFDTNKQSFGPTFNEFLSFVHEGDRAMVNEVFTKLLNNKTPFGPIFYRLVMNNGEIKYVEARGEAIYNDNGTPIKASGVIQNITDRKIIENALIESEDKFRSIFHSLTAGMIIVVDEEGKVMEWNEGAELNFGYTNEEMIKQSLSVFMPERFRVNHAKGMAMAIKNRGLSNKGKTHELFGLRKNGDEFPMELTLGCWERNGKLFFSAIMIDVSLRKANEKSILRANSILDDVGSIILLTNMKGNVVYTTSTLKKNTGYEPHEVLGDKWWEVTFANSKDSELTKNELISYSLDKKIIRTTNHPRLVKCKDGTLKWFEWHNSRGIDDCIISVGYDITERIVAEEEINKLSRAINQSPITVVITDLNGNIEYANPKFEQTTGYSLQEVKGKNPRILKSGETSLQVYKKLWDTISSGEVWKGEFHNVRKDGIMYWEKASIAPIFNRLGEIINYVALKEDITEKKATEKQLQFTLNNLENLVNARTEQLENTLHKLEISLNKEKELNELKSKFVSTASHQFRTPLTVIQANIGLINMHVNSLGIELKDKLARVTTRIQSEVDRMTELMNDVLILGRINSGNVLPEFQQTNIVVIANDICSKHNDIQTDGRKIECMVKGNPYLLLLDPKLVGHSISNLISNAFKYSINKPSPELTITYEKNKVSISVKDYGIGIPAKELKNLFQTFYRASNANNLPGTGLGVAIAKEYTELNGGDINVVSVLNQGTEFILTYYNK